jgi:hypothetical protein
LWHGRITEEGRHNLLGGTHMGIHRIHAAQGSHAAIAGPLFLFEHRHLRGIFFHQRHAFAVARGDQNRAFLGRCRWRQGIEKTIRLFSHGAIDAFEDIHRQPLPENRLELPGPHAECFFDAEKLRKLLQQIGGLALGEIKAGIDGTQFDLLFAVLRIDVRLEGVLAKDGSQRSGHGCVTAIKDGALWRADAVAKIAIPLRVQKQLDGGVSHVQDASQRATFGGGFTSTMFS